MVELLKQKMNYWNSLSLVKFEGGGGEDAYWKTSALYEAIENENIDIVKILLSNNRFNNKNNYNERLFNMKEGDAPFEGKWLKTELFRAIEKNNSEIVRLIVQNNVFDVDHFNLKIEKDDECFLWKKTALYEAVEQGNAEIVKLLIQNTSDINLLNIDSGIDDYDYVKRDEPNYHDRNNFVQYSQKTALYLAVENKNIEIIKILLTNLNNNLDIYNIDDYYLLKSNNTVIDLANQINDTEIINLLSDYKINKTLRKQSSYDEMIDKELLKETIRPFFDEYYQSSSAVSFVNRLLHRILEIMTKEILEKSNHINITCDDVENTFTYLFSSKFLNVFFADIHNFISNYYADESSLTISIDKIKKLFQKSFNNIDVNDDVYVYLSFIIEVFFNIGCILDDDTYIIQSLFPIFWNSSSKYKCSSLFI